MSNYKDILFQLTVELFGTSSAEQRQWNGKWTANSSRRQNESVIWLMMSFGTSFTVLFIITVLSYHSTTFGIFSDPSPCQSLSHHSLPTTVTVSTVNSFQSKHKFEWSFPDTQFHTNTLRIN